MRTFNFLSQRLYSGSIEEIVKIIEDWLVKGVGRYVCVTGLHGLLYAEQHQDFALTLRKGTVVPDGMPIVWAGRIAGYKTERIYGPDLMKSLCKMAAINNKRIYLYGTTKETLDILRRKLIQLYPTIQIVGYHAPPFAKQTEKQMVPIYTSIKKTNPDIIFVGLSTPKQEEWMNISMKHFPKSILVGVGAAFDFISGTKRQSPRWIQLIGMEWFFRFCMEPRRLWKRYVGVLSGICLILLKKIFYKTKNKRIKG